MTSVDSGLKDLTWAAKDSPIEVVNNAIADTDTDSPFVGLKDGTSNLLPDQLMFSFEITAVGTGAIFKMLIYAVFSEDGDAEDPPTGSSENKKILIASLNAESANDVLSRSNIYAVPVLGNYFRLVYENVGSGESVTISSRYAKSYQQSYSA